MNPNEFPPEIKRAFEQYPQIEPSAAFNRTVLQSLEAAQDARRLTLIGRIEELLGLKLWQFAASGLLGAFFPALVLSVLLLSNRGAVPMAPTQMPTNPMMPHPIGPLFAREWWLDADRRAMQPRRAPATGSSARQTEKQGDELSCVELNSPLV